MIIAKSLSTGQLLFGTSSPDTIENKNRLLLDAENMGYELSDTEIIALDDTEYKNILTATKNTKPKYLKSKYWQEYIDFLDQGFTYAGVVYKCTPEHQDSWESFSKHIERKLNLNLLALTDTLELRAKDKSMNSITVEDFLNDFCVQMGDHIFAARQAYWAKYDAI